MKQKLIDLLQPFLDYMCNGRNDPHSVYRSEGRCDYIICDRLGTYVYRCMDYTYKE